MRDSDPDKRRRRPPAGRQDDVETDNDRFDDEDEDSDEPVRGGVSDRATRGRSGGRVDFRDFDEDDPSSDSQEELAAPRSRRSRRSASETEQVARLSLLDLSTPVFACAALLPREGGSSSQPGYLPFREQVLNALKGIELRASDNDIDPGDAKEAVYALSMFIDEQVNQSDWTSKSQWASEPLGILLQGDPDGGVHFFDRLEALTPRQDEVKQVLLVCLALGFRGKYVHVDPAQEAQELSELRQRVLRTMVPTPMGKQKQLFPTAYTAAVPVMDRPQRPPAWWIVTSVSVAVLCLLIFVLMLWWAGQLPEPRADELAPLLNSTQSLARVWGIG